MSWNLLVPAAMTVLCLVTLAWSMHRLDGELQALRHALRRSRVAAVAADDLRHTTRSVVEEINKLDESTQARADRRRVRHHTPRR
ncbi:MAG: hypothetical protein P8J50_10240 [Acidimicrobiales bacterium]|nr:hypothetical protein [Acidimicrobiales bacterium]